MGVIKMNENKTNINWYPGHMAKTRRKIIDELKNIDIVYELVDSRIPKSSKIKDIDNLIKNKKRILIMTKKDLCDLNITNKWAKYYENKGYYVLIVDLKNNDDYKKIIKVTHEITKEIQNNPNLIIKMRERLNRLDNNKAVEKINELINKEL